jgi:hypothetical protein
MGADIDEGDLHLFVMQRVEIEQLESRLKEVRANHRVLSEKLHIDIQAANLRSIPHTELGRFTPIAKLYVNLAKPVIGSEGDLENEDARAKLEEWSKQQVHPGGGTLFEDIFGWVVKPARLKSVVKDRLEENLDPPPGVEIGYVKDIQYTKPR